MFENFDMNDKKGFSGLNNLGTEIDDIIEEHNHNNTLKDENKNSASESKKNKRHTNTGATNSTDTNVSDINENEDKGSLAWLWWSISVGIVIWLIIQTNSGGSSSSAKSLYTKPVKIDDYYESKPEIYADTLDKNQLLYCEAEKIRLDTVENKIDKYSSYEVDKYNRLSNDYNSRCANKQYYKNNMYYVKRNIEKKKSQLQEDGLNRFNTSYKNKYILTVNATPHDARIRILNIKPKYKDGIRLNKGSYHIEISKKGYKTIKKWVSLDKDMTYTAKLTR